MQTRFKKNAKIFDIAITAIAGMVSVGIMLYGILHFGLKESWPELVLNMFYIACLVMIWMYFFNYRITTNQFNYWCSVCVGITVLLRDILFPPPLAFYALHLICFTLSVLLLCMLTYFYARKDWQRRIHQLYADGNLDSSYHHLWVGSLFRNGKGKGLRII